MQIKRLSFVLGITLLLVAAATFVAGRWVNGGGLREDRVSHVTPASEIPTKEPEISGLLVERKDNTVILQTVSFDAGSGWALGESDEPMDTSSGPEEVSQASIQQVVREATLDELNSQMMITVWGRKDGDRIIADLLLAEHLKE